MLRRHQCCVDLQANSLRIGTTGTAVPFLGEGELPKRAFGGANHGEDEGEASMETQPQQTQGGAAATAGTTPDVGGKVQQLASLGFSPEACERALASTGGNVDMAASLLFEQSGGMGGF